MNGWQILDDYVNQETREHPPQIVTVVFVARKTLNQRSLLLVFPRAITWRLHCIIRLCNKQSQSSTAIGITNRFFI
jgi:hypothetical protein